MRYLSGLAALIIASFWPGAAVAQTAPPPTSAGQPATLLEDEPEIVVMGQRPRGSVISDIPPTLQLDAGDVRSLGISSIGDLLTELGPQVRSNSGGPPLVLLEGHRISSFREIATLPAEAIARVDILPEEVALSYGSSPNQKVINIVLRKRFRAFTLEGTDRVATDGGANRADGEYNFLTINKGSRFNLNASYATTDRLTEGQRGITALGGGESYRTLIPAEQEFKLNSTFTRTFSPQWSLTLNGELTTDQTHA